MKQPTETAGASVIALIPVDRIRPDPKNRKDFAHDEIASLAQSIETEGLLQPVVVRRVDPAEAAGEPIFYQLIAGERRWLAHKELKRESIEARIVDTGSIAMRAAENMQRVNLTPIETAKVYQELLDAGSSHTEVAKIAGRSQSDVSNTLRLLKLPTSVQALVDSGELSRAHGVALARFAAWPDVCTAIAKCAIEDEAPAKDLESGVPFSWRSEVNAHVKQHYFDKLPKELVDDPDCIVDGRQVYCFKPGRLEPFIECDNRAVNKRYEASVKASNASPDQVAEAKARAAARQQNIARRGELSMQFARALTVLQRTKVCNALLVSILAAEAVKGGYVSGRIREVADKLGLKCPAGVIPSGGQNGLRNVDVMAKMDPCDVVKLAVGVILSKETDDALRNPTGFVPEWLNRVADVAKIVEAKRVPKKPSRPAKLKLKPGKKPRRAVITDETRSQVLRAVNEGRTGAEIAKKLGISLPSVQNIKKALGLVRRAA